MTTTDNLVAGQQALANLAAATEAAAGIPGAIWNPMFIPMLPDARGNTLTVGRTLRIDADGPVFAYCMDQQLGGFPDEASARQAIEAHVTAVLAGRVPVEDSLMAADLLAVLKPLALRPVSYARSDLQAARDAIANAEGRGIRAQSFNDRERDLLAANNALLERVRKTEQAHKTEMSDFRALAARARVAEARIAEIEAAPGSATASVRSVRHVKRGSIYDVIGEGEVQISRQVQLSTGTLVTARMIYEGDKLTVYRCEQSGKLYLRFPDEFNDGRFEERPV